MKDLSQGERQFVDLCIDTKICVRAVTKPATVADARLFPRYYNVGVLGYR